MIAIDCENIKTIYLTLEKILNISIDKILNFIKNLDLDEFYQKNADYFDTGDKALFDLLTQNINIKYSKIDYTYWFHLTRTNKNKLLNDGLLPLGLIIDKIWNYLYSLINLEINEYEWKSFRKHLENDMGNHYAELYRLKLNNKNSWGPYAMLIKESAFKSSEMGNHDYLKIPEIIEDICICFEEKYKINLAKIFINNTKPCIIKFSVKGGEYYLLKPILYYIYCTMHNKSLSIYSNTCFNAEGELINSDSILKIEYINKKAVNVL